MAECSRPQEEPLAEKLELAEATAPPLILSQSLRKLVKAIRTKPPLGRKKKAMAALKVPGHKAKRPMPRPKDTPQAWLSTSRTDSVSH